MRVVAVRAPAFVVVIVAIATSSSCSSSEFDGGPKHNIVVLSSSAVALTKSPVVLSPSGITKVSGVLSSVCFVIKDGLPMQDMKSMEKVFADAMDGVEIATTLGLSSGKSVSLSKPTLSWAEDGVILKRGELAACSAPPCGVTLPLGVRVDSVEVAAVPDFLVKGIYWESVKDPSESSATSTATKLSSESASASDCAGSKEG